MILGREHVVAFENPTYKQAYRLFRGLAYKTVPVGMDKNGMKVTELSDSGADIAYVTPSHQYPTGIIMPIGRRMELLKWAKEEPDRYACLYVGFSNATTCSLPSIIPRSIKM